MAFCAAACQKNTVNFIVAQIYKMDFYGCFLMHIPVCKHWYLKC